MSDASRPSDHGESEIVERHIACPDEDGCGSSDAFNIYDDGHGFCFACNRLFPPRKLAEMGYDVDASRDRGHGDTKGRVRVTEDVKQALESGTIRALTKWKITQETATHWDYRTRVNSRGEAEHLMPYRDEHGALIGVKVRNTGVAGESKDFYWIGGQPKGALYGAHLLGKGGKMVVVTAGEKDALTLSQLWGNKFPVVSPPGGEPNAAKDLAPWIAALSRYEQVVICWDQDETGQRTLPEVARIFPPGKAFIAKLSQKDATEMVLAGETAKLTSAIHNAVPYQPDGIVDADEIDGQLLTPTQWGASLPYPFMTTWTYGMRDGEVWVIGAGTGIGKSDLAAECVAHGIKPQEDGGNFEPWAVFNYESGSLQTLKLVLGKLASKRFNIPDPADGEPNVYWTPEDMEQARLYRRERCAKLFINDHKGAISWASVKERLRFLKHSYGIKRAVVDPMAAMAAGEDDERKALDNLMAEAKQLAEELGITIVFVSHLARPKDGKSHEEGGRVELRHFRGSGAITMWASFVFGLERDQQGEDGETEPTVVRVLKDRYTGDSTGQTRTLVYNSITGRLEEAVPSLEQAYEAPTPPPLED